MYEHSLAVANKEDIDRASIPLENAGGPVLLYGSDADAVWMSATMATGLASRLKAKGFSHPVTAITYPSSGHLIWRPYMPTTLSKANGGSFWLDLGGTPQGTAEANSDSWAKLLNFLSGF
jgi:hypothetical protein